MWYLKKVVWISSAHKLAGYKGSCQYLHGHNWKVTVYCKGDKLDELGMLVDFNRIKNEVKWLDHKDLNEILPINPTAENLAKFIQGKVPMCFQVNIEETEGSVVTYVAESK